MMELRLRPSRTPTHRGDKLPACQPGRADKLAACGYDAAAASKLDCSVTFPVFGDD